MKLLFLIIAGVCLVFSTSMYAEAKTYNVDRDGVAYTFEYPNNWKKDAGDLNRFSGIDARVVKGANDAQMNLQSGDILDFPSCLTSDTLEAMAETNFDDGTAFESGEAKYTVNNQTVNYAIVQFERTALFGDDLQMVGMVSCVHLDDDHIIVVQYIAEDKDFDKYLPQVEKVIQSVKGVGNGTGTGTGTGTDNSFTSRGEELPKTTALCDTVTTQSGKDLCETLLS